MVFLNLLTHSLRVHQFATVAPSIVFQMKLPRWSSLAWLDQRGKTGTASERWRPSRKLIYSMTVFRGNVFVYVLISKKLRFSRHDVNRFLLLEGLWRKLFYRIFDLQCTIKFIMQLRFVKIHFSCFRKIDYKNS